MSPSPSSDDDRLQGQRLSELIRVPRHPFRGSRWWRLAWAISEQLKPYHQQGRGHGRVRDDQIRVMNDRSVRLPEPLGDVAVAFDRIADDPYRAPEARDRHPDTPQPAADYYALGCLLYRLRFDEYPPPQEFPARLHAAIDAPRTADPADRVLAYLLANRPEARFSSLDQLRGALRAGARMHQASKQEQNPEPSPTAQLVSIPEKTDAPLPTAERDSAEPLRRRRRRRSPVPVVLGMLSIPLLALAIVLVLRASRDPAAPVSTAQRRPMPTDRIPPVVGSAPRTGRDGTTPTSSSVSGTNKEGRLWAPPDSDPDSRRPISLAGLPPGPGLILHVRWPDWSDNGPATTIRQSLAPELSPVITAVNRRAKVSPSWIDTVTASLHPGNGGQPEVTLTLGLGGEADREAWLRSAYVSPAQTADGQTVYTSDETDDVYYWSDQADPVRSPRLTIGTPDRVGEVAELGGEPIVLPGNLERMWGKSRRADSLTLIATPNFVLSDARSALRSVVAHAEPALRQFLIPDVGAWLSSIRITEDRMYLEIRVSPSGGVRDVELLGRLHEQSESIPEVVESFLISSRPDASWLPLAIRLPRMWSYANRQVRFGLEDNHAVANAYLPLPAANQLIVGSLLAMHTEPGSDGGVADSRMANRPNGGMAGSDQPVTAQQWLARSITIAIDQESLETTLALVREEFNATAPAGWLLPPIEIRGNDLRAAGITQNQQITNLRYDAKPLRDVLTAVVMAANPDRTAITSSDPNQALVWIAEEDPPRLVITTREAVADQDRLPREFVIP